MRYPFKIHAERSNFLKYCCIPFILPLHLSTFTDVSQSMEGNEELLEWLCCAPIFSWSSQEGWGGSWRCLGTRVHAVFWSWGFGETPRRLQMVRTHFLWSAECSLTHSLCQGLMSFCACSFEAGSLPVSGLCRWPCTQLHFLWEPKISSYAKVLRETPAVALRMGNTLNFYSQLTHLIPLHGVVQPFCKCNKGGDTFLAWDKV